jgi:hypothetical protein
MKHYFRFIYLWLCIVIIGYSFSAKAILCIPATADQNSVSDYFDHMVAAMEMVKEAVATISVPHDDATEVFVAYKTADQQFDCAISQISSFENSKDENIKTSAKGLDTAVSKIKQCTADGLTEIKSKLNGESKPEGAGDHADKMANLAMRFKEGYQVLTASAMMATFAAIDDSKKSKDEKADHIKLTKDQSAALIRRLDKIAGSEQNGNRTYLPATAHSLANWFRQTWKFASK